MTHRIEIRQFGNELASFPTTSNVEHEIDEHEFMAACAVADSLHMHGRLETGYYEVVLVNSQGGDLDSMEAVA
ncbi:hypothetical protein OF001_U20232 [Pseudomonas sp. OF001]|uniref:hypothetical protein n=1 Tax=Pseudomonas sp. OF001 TaxID=2772300 RepID=UPI001919CAAF|nr:hypothetical protein [Pseudomonas sp. OF001]CAD5377305.1 hypothetical protein OF001_U20232 [Pseudomonas sp. OF001]